MRTYQYDDAMDLLDYAREHIDAIERALDPKMTPVRVERAKAATRHTMKRLRDIGALLETL